MRVKVGNTWYEVKPGQPIMIELTEADKKNIANMLPEATKYASFDDCDPYYGLFPDGRHRRMVWMEAKQKPKRNNKD